MNSHTETAKGADEAKLESSSGPGMDHVELIREEKSMGKISSIRTHPLAFAWAAYGAWQILLVSYENMASGTIVGIPQFRKDFGSAYDGNWVLDARWQAAFSAGPVGSQVIGALTAGIVADFLGRKRTFMAAFAIGYAAITLEVVATTNEVFFGGKFLNGFAVGTLKAVSATYIGEVAPISLRGLMTCFIGLGYTIGPLIVALIVTGTGTIPNRWAYRAVFCSQYAVATISVAFVFFMPESPWWLVRKERHPLALRSLRRLGYSESEAETHLAEIKDTLEKIRQETEGATYLECFRRSNLRRTIISVMPLLIQTFAGSLFTSSYFTYYAQLAGFSTQMSFRLSIAQQVLSLAGNVVSWFLVDRIGRRSLIIYGTSTLCALLWIMAGLAVQGNVAAVKGAVSMILIFGFAYNVGIGAVCFTILTESSTARLRMKTIAIGLASQNSLYLGWSFALPYLFNPDHLNLGGKVGFIFGSTSIVCIIYLWFYQPETRNRSFLELDEMFIKGVKARDFKTYRSTLEEQAETNRLNEKTE
ncbi:hypothetical protein ACHAPT_005448 [Fusarium lateritium]